MLVTIGIYKGQKNELNKGFSPLKSYPNVILKEGTDIMHPVLTVEGYYIHANYMYIPDFHRYYYITTKIVRNGLIEITGTCDVLKSFSNEIRSCKGVVDLSQEQNPYLVDDRYITESKKEYEYLPYQGKLSNDLNYILVCAGGE